MWQPLSGLAQIAHAGSIHEEWKCHRLLKSELEFSATIKYWYNRIYAYRQMIRAKEGMGKFTDGSRTVQQAKYNSIKDPNSLTIVQYKDGIILVKVCQK